MKILSAFVAVALALLISQDAFGATTKRFTFKNLYGKVVGVTVVENTLPIRSTCRIVGYNRYHCKPNQSFTQSCGGSDSLKLYLYFANDDRVYTRFVVCS